MKYTNSLVKGISFLILLSISPLYLFSQTMCESNCQVQCQSQINVSLDHSCMATITPAMGGVGITSDCNYYYSLQLWDEYDNLIPYNKVDINYDGHNLKYEITEPECGNKCWGYVKIEYKLPPLIECPPDDTLTCGALNILDLPPATGGCADFEVFLFKEERNPFVCDPLYTQSVTRTYKARDQFGNESECSHTILLERIDLDAIIFPEIRTVGNGNAISCNDPYIEYDENGFPVPYPTDPATGSGTGVPILCDLNITNGLYCPTTGSGNGVPLIPDNMQSGLTGIPTSLACSAAVFYTDIELPKIGCVRKIMRTWEVREWWCSAENVAGAVQLIEIIDDEAPHFYCPVDFTASTGYDCAGEVLMPAVTAYDECGSVINVAIDYPNGILYENGGYVDLDLGHNVVEYIVSDECYNTSNCYVNVYVEDNTNPVAICEQYKVVSISQSGNTIVYADPFDNGSWDECALDRFEVRRMDTLCVAADTLFGESVTFCCSDVGNDVMVVFRVWDQAGNYNDCMVTVEVQDKSVPVIDCPPDMTIDCRDGYDLNNLALTFGELTTYDVCSAENAHEVVTPDVNQCGIGTIARKFEIRDDAGNVLRSCKQVITITNNTPFVGSNIIWPADFDLTGGCSLQDLSPENLPEPYGFPTFTHGDDECSLLGYDYEDSVYQAIPGSGECAHIERRWKVINWCSQINGYFEIWENPFPQIIKLINDISPEIEPQDDVLYENQSVDCINSNVVIERSATDDCNNALFWTYTLRDNNGYVIGTGNSNILVDTLPAGFYEIEWTVQDGCGNFDIDYQNLEVRNIKAPSPVCINGLSASLVLMDLDNDGIHDAEMVELWASDFDAHSYHSCNNPITLSFTQDTTVKSWIYDCDDIGINIVRLYVTDVITGAQDYCETFIDIQDNNGDNVCEEEDQNGRVVIEGDIYTEYDDNVEGVMVEIGIPDLEVMTDDEGDYAFAAMLPGGSYLVNPVKDDDHLNGISTLDLIMMQKHILGIEYLDSPYKMIAADVNNSKDISSVDLIELRKLILGVYNELPNNESWRFVDASYNFTDPYNPWLYEFPEEYEIFKLDQDMDIDFIGVKIGDLNQSVIANYNGQQISERSNKNLSFNIENGNIKVGERGTIDLRSDNYENILGWQSTFGFDAAKVEILEINGVAIEDFSEGNYNIASQEEGWMTISYNGDVQSVDKNEIILEIVVRAKKDIQLNSVLHINSDITPTESYSQNGVVQGISIDNMETEFESRIVGVQPNPWIEKTNLRFELSSEDRVELKFYDVNGRLVYSDSGNFQKGMNSYTLTNGQFTNKGVIYIQMITSDGIKDYKMIIL